MPKCPAHEANAMICSKIRRACCSCKDVAFSVNRIERIKSLSSSLYVVCMCQQSGSGQCLMAIEIQSLPSEPGYRDAGRALAIVHSFLYLFHMLFKQSVLQDRLARIPNDTLKIVWFVCCGTTARSVAAVSFYSVVISKIRSIFPASCESFGLFRPDLYARDEPR